MFWKNIEPLLPDKGISTTSIFLIGDDKMITEDTEVANTLNMHFETAVNSIGITENKQLLTENGNLEDSIEISIKKFKNHPSILSIDQDINVEQSFQFSEVTSEEVLSEINNLDSKNVGSYKNVPTKILKNTSEISSEHLAKIWNEQVIRSENFPNVLKLADSTLIFKKIIQHWQKAKDQ